MATIVLVEDDADKEKHVVQVIQSAVPELQLEIFHSYNTGLKRLLQPPTPDVVVLDMSMRTFDINRHDKGGRMRIYGGRDILDELARHEIRTAVLVVTRYEKFGEGVEHITQDELHAQLTDTFPNLFVTLIYYRPAYSNWRSQLRAELQALISRRK